MRGNSRGKDSIPDQKKSLGSWESMWTVWGALNFLPFCLIALSIVSIVGPGKEFSLFVVVGGVLLVLNIFLIREGRRPFGGVFLRGWFYLSLFYSMALLGFGSVFSIGGHPYRVAFGLLDLSTGVVHLLFLRRTFMEMLSVYRERNRRVVTRARRAYREKKTGGKKKAERLEALRQREREVYGRAIKRLEEEGVLKNSGETKK